MDRAKLKSLIKKYVKESIIEIIVEEPEIIQEALSNTTDFPSDNTEKEYKSVKMMNEVLFGDRANMVDPIFNPRINKKMRTRKASEASSLLEMIKSTNCTDENQRIKDYITEKRKTEKQAYENNKNAAIMQKAKRMFGENSYLFEALASGPEFVTDELALQGVGNVDTDSVGDASFDEFANMTNDLFEAAAFGAKGKTDEHVDLDMFGNFVEKNKKVEESIDASNIRVENGVILPEGYEVDDESYNWDDERGAIVENVSYSSGDDFMAMPTEEPKISAPPISDKLNIKKATITEDNLVPAKKGAKDEVAEKIENNDLEHADVNDLDFVPASGEDSDTVVEK